MPYGDYIFVFLGEVLDEQVDRSCYTLAYSNIPEEYKVMYPCALREEIEEQPPRHYFCLATLT